MRYGFVYQSAAKLIPVTPVVQSTLESWLLAQSPTVQSWVKNTKFEAASGSTCLIPGKNAEVVSVLLGIENTHDFKAFGALPGVLPEGVYLIQDYSDLAQAALGFGLGYYEFSRYKVGGAKRLAKLLIPESVGIHDVENKLSAIYLARELINTPAEHMSPQELEDAVKEVAKTFSASFSVIKGDKLLKENYPSVHVVGRASPREPRVIDLTWGKKDAPLVTLVGKGVCFDSGGYDLKNASGMLLMKKDMAGAAMMLALAQIIMSHALPVRLRLLIGAVENLVAGNSYKPGDIIKTRSGKTIEINNTDAEGRVVLSDLLTEAVSESPDILIDFATLTGAGRVALGTDIPALFAQHDETAQQIMACGKAVGDPVWQLPLVSGYFDSIKSKFADISNCADGPWGGCITAALFLQAFVGNQTNWVHCDVPAWNFDTKPGRPVGGEVFGVRAVFEYLRRRYA